MKRAGDEEEGTRKRACQKGKEKEYQKSVFWGGGAERDADVYSSTARWFAGSLFSIRKRLTRDQNSPSFRKWCFGP